MFYKNLFVVYTMLVKIREYIFYKSRWEITQKSKAFQIIVLSIHKKSDILFEKISYMTHTKYKEILE